MKFDLTIKGGLIATAAETFRGDIGINGETIAAIGQGFEGQREIDASGKLVIPGAIDPHVHLEMPQGPVTSSDDFATGTLAAAYGGTTTIIDFVEPEENETLLEALAIRQAQAQGKAVIDYGLHMTLTNARPETLAQVPEVVQAGCASFKTYTIYEGFYLEDDEMLKVLQAVAQAGGMVITHCENRHVVAFKQQQFLAERHTEPRYHPRSRPPIVEGEAIERVLTLAAVSNCPQYVVHCSTAAGAAAIQRARARGQQVYGETCPQYLLLTDAEYDKPGFEGAKFICSPPLRPADNPPALWDQLAKRNLHSIGTDHCPFFFQGQKDIVTDDFTRIPGGLPGIEARLSLIYSFGVGSGRISLNRWVEICATAPAKIFGMYPQKGILAPGADADVVVFDPDKEVTLTHSMLHEHVDYTPYEGMTLQGYPAVTIRRGEVLVQDGKFVGGKGGGRFLPRALKAQ